MIHNSFVRDLLLPSSNAEVKKVACATVKNTNLISLKNEDKEPRRWVFVEDDKGELTLAVNSSTLKQASKHILVTPAFINHFSKELNPTKLASAFSKYVPSLKKESKELLTSFASDVYKIAKVNTQEIADLAEKEGVRDSDLLSEDNYVTAFVRIIKPTLSDKIAQDIISTICYGLENSLNISDLVRKNILATGIPLDTIKEVVLFSNLPNKETIVGKVSAPKPSPKTDIERVKNHFELADKDIEEIGENARKKLIDSLPPRGTGLAKKKKSDFNYNIDMGLSGGDYSIEKLKPELTKKIQALKLRYGLTDDDIGEIGDSALIKLLRIQDVVEKISPSTETWKSFSDSWVTNPILTSPFPPQPKTSSFNPLDTTMKEDEEGIITFEDINGKVLDKEEIKEYLDYIAPIEQKREDDFFAKHEPTDAEFESLRKFI